MKKPRVSVIKDNMQPQTSVPMFDYDCEVGQWVDQQMAQKGHKIDRTGMVDMPEFGIDNKTRKKGSKSAHTIGSMTIDDIIDTPNWIDTSLCQKTQNQNQIVWDPDFLEITKVDIVDMDIDVIQEKLSLAYSNGRAKILAGDRSKNIKSDCGWMIFDGYGHVNSYRLRIPDAAMKKIHSISEVRDSFTRTFDVS